MYATDTIVDPESWGVAESGLILPVSLVNKRPTAIDLFAGAGGFSLGLMQAGFEVVGAVENDPTASLTYLTNLGLYPGLEFHFVDDQDKGRMEAAIRKSAGLDDKSPKGIVSCPIAGSGYLRDHPELPGVPHFFFGDASKLTGKDILNAIGMERGELDLVCGGPPCQGFSTSGKRDIMDPRNSLIFEFARLVCELRPQSMVLENVPAVVSMVTPEGIPVVDAFCRILEEGDFGGYEALRKSLLSHPDAKAMYRGQKAGKSGQSPSAEQTNAEASKNEPHATQMEIPL